MKYLTKTNKEKLVSDIKSNNLSLIAAKNFILSLGYSPNVVPEVIQEAFSGPTEKKNLKALLTEDFEYLLSKSKTKVFSKEELVDELLKLGYNNSVITKFVDQYIMVKELISSNNFKGYTENSEKLLKSLGVSDENIQKFKNLSKESKENGEILINQFVTFYFQGLDEMGGDFLPRPTKEQIKQAIVEANNPPLLFDDEIEECVKRVNAEYDRRAENKKILSNPDLNNIVSKNKIEGEKIRVVSGSITTTYPYLQIKGELENNECFIIRRDEQYYYFGRAETEGKIELLKYVFQGNTYQFANYMLIEGLEDFILE